MAIKDWIERIDPGVVEHRRLTKVGVEVDCWPDAGLGHDGDKAWVVGREEPLLVGFVVRCVADGNLGVEEDGVN